MQIGVSNRVGYATSGFQAHSRGVPEGPSHCVVRPLLSIVACLHAIVVWVVYTFRASPGSFSIFLSFVVIAFVAEGLLQRYPGRRILDREHWGA
jgi:hypothetical protein